jgi:hypothetical protein
MVRVMGQHIEKWVSPREICRSIAPSKLGFDSFFGLGKDGSKKVILKFSELSLEQFRRYLNLNLFFFMLP